MYTYKITSLTGQIQTNICPPPIVNAIFPNFNGELVIVKQDCIIVEFETKQNPVNLGPTIKVDLEESDA